QAHFDVHILSVPHKAAPLERAIRDTGRRESRLRWDVMIDFLKMFRPTPPQPRPIPAVPKRPARKVDGKYLLLNEYLENRYANTVVLSFGQIEDLVGSALPDVARTDMTWWTADPAAGESRHAQA